MTVTISRRSFVNRRSALAAHATPTQRLEIALTDLSLLPRWGLKGRNAISWLEQAGAVIPDRNNKTAVQRDGSIVARLSPGEVLVLSSEPGKSEIGAIIDTLPPGGQGACYPLPRADSHCWFQVDGPRSADMFAKLCAVDLAPDQFPDGAVAQTSVARLSAIVIRRDNRDRLAFAVLCESASAEYLWDCLTDAMVEYAAADGASGILPPVAVKGDFK